MNTNIEIPNKPKPPITPTSVLHSLSEREYEVMYLIAHGYTAEEISKELYVAIQTVHTYRARIKEKLSTEESPVRNNVEITIKAIHLNIVAHHPEAEPSVADNLVWYNGYLMTEDEKEQLQNSRN